MINATHIEGPTMVLTLFGSAEHNLWKAEDGTYLVSSSVNNDDSEETIVFESDDMGLADPETFRTLAVVGPDSHEEALNEAGYTAVRP